jgi:dipeptidyl aminopeptidase/acylaminoacyl peptidase
LPVTDEQELLEIGREISPISHVSPDDPPVFIMHGDADAIVPIQQARTFFAKLEEQGVTARLDVRTGEGHGWANIQDDWRLVADWFDQHLQAK